ncbi:MAG: DUF3857 domain-containing protein [Bacteroidetes bacterium]|nr:DUF3857 domain-containing protein [Bacteroidota bacterium]
MKNLIYLLILLTRIIDLPAQNGYPVIAIPTELLPNANIIIRANELSFNVLNKGSAIETEHLVMTLMNEKAAKYSEPVFYYDNFTEIVDIDASVYDASGKLVRSLKKKDIEDAKPLNYYVNDIRMKILHLPGRSYPYTIEYTVVQKHKGLMFYPVFEPQGSSFFAIENASFEVLMPTGLELRQKEINIPTGSKIGQHKWTLKNIKAFKPEPYVAENALGLPKVITAPTQFSFGGIDGDMSTWESYGLYLDKLNKSQADIPRELQQKLRKIIEGCTDDYCRIERVYEYLQSNTRYYYIGFGIGGWQPTSASLVDKNKFGDCKGLSNYTVAMLNSIGIPARYSIIRAGEDEQYSQYPDFPNPRFNHAIACVPMPRDTIWLECTNQTQSCGFMGTFTDNRPALVVTPTGGQLWETPRYDETKNTITRQTSIQIKTDGSASLESQTIYSGIAQNIPAELDGVNEELQRKYLYNTLSVKDFEIKSLTFTRKKERLPSVNQIMSLTLPNYGTANGKRLFLPMNLLAGKLDLPIFDGERKSSFQPDSRGYTELDSMTLEIPNGYELESQFEPINLGSPYGSFENKLQVLEGKLLVTRKLVLNSKVQPKEQFLDFVNFLKAVVKADNAKLVLVKKVGP